MVLDLGCARSARLRQSLHVTEAKIFTRLDRLLPRKSWIVTTEAAAVAWCAAVCPISAHHARMEAPLHRITANID
jgi:hypothetical protein